MTETYKCSRRSCGAQHPLGTDCPDRPINHDYDRYAGSKYGAPMGRSGGYGGAVELDCSARLRLSQVPLDSGGYDPGGAYWGAPDWRRHGDPKATACLYCAEDHEGGTLYLRAWTRDEAKRKVLAKFPGARFYR